VLSCSIQTSGALRPELVQEYNFSRHASCSRTNRTTVSGYHRLWQDHSRSISNDVTKGNAGITEKGVVFLTALSIRNTLDIRQCRNITESALDGIKQLPIQNILTDTL